MLTEEQQHLFQAAKQAQVARNEAVHIILSEASLSVLHGAFVRVLLELQDHREDYIIARIGCIATGEAYGGFSTNTNIRTDKYLVLSLPLYLASINGTQYQLNSISNSTMTDAEFARWLEMMQPSANAVPQLDRSSDSGDNSNIGFSIPTRQELLAVAERIRATNPGGRHGQGYGLHRQRGLTQLQHPGRPAVSFAVQAGSQLEAQPMSPLRSTNRNSAATVMNAISSAYGELSADNVHGSHTGGTGSGGAVRFARQATVMTINGCNNQNNNNHENNTAGFGMPLVASQQTIPLFHGTVSPRPVSASAAVSHDLTAPEREFDLPTRRQIRQDVINKMSQRSVVFPLNISELKVSQLRLTERDMIEYLEHVREAVSSKQENCVVCMDHVPTVISLPCRHKVLCRLCASSVSTCPVCRSQLFELFEPKEI